MLLPLVVIVALSWVVFWMDREALGRRAGISVTGILTVIAYQFIVAESLPRVAYLTAMDRMTLLSLLMIAATMCESILVDRIGQRDEGARSRIDAVCRWAFPLVYFGGLAIVAAPFLLR